MTQGATFSHIYDYSYTGTHGDPSSWLRQDSQRNTRAKRGPKHPQLSPVSDLRKTVDVKGLLQHAAPAQSLGSAPLPPSPAGRARNAAHPIRRPQGARPRPRPLSPLPSLVSVGA